MEKLMYEAETCRNMCKLVQPYILMFTARFLYFPRTASTFSKIHICSLGWAGGKVNLTIMKTQKQHTIDLQNRQFPTDTYHVLQIIG